MGTAGSDELAVKTSSAAATSAVNVATSSTLAATRTATTRGRRVTGASLPQEAPSHSGEADQRPQVDVARGRDEPCHPDARGRRLGQGPGRVRVRVMGGADRFERGVDRR